MAEEAQPFPLVSLLMSDILDDALPTAEEQQAVEAQQAELVTYDPSVDSFLQGQIDEIFAGPRNNIDELAQAAILAAVGKKEFPLALQYEMYGNAVEVRTLGDLADSRSDEHAQQFIYPTSIRKILFGKYGIAKGRRLSSNIEICYRRNRAGELSDFVITSGRHRVVSIIALLQKLGVKKWRDQKVQVVCKVVNSDAEFAQLIETANDSRKMPRAETQIHGLTKVGVRTSNFNEFYETRTYAKSAQLGHVFAKAVQFELVELPQVSQDSVVSMVGSAWNKVYAIGENKDRMRELIIGDDPTPLRNAASRIASQAIQVIAEAPTVFPQERPITAAPKLCALKIAETLGVEAPSYN